MLLHAIVPAEAVVDPKGMVQVYTPRLCACASAVEVDMLQHHRNVEWLHAASGACLPVRFPTRVESAEALRELLEKHEAELLAALERVRGRCELAVTAAWATAQEAT